MRTLIASMACASVLALSSVSQAGQISSPTIFGTAEQDGAECTVLNGGTGTTQVTVKIIDDFAQTVATRNCGPVGAGQFCSLFTPIDNAEAHACVVVTPGSSTNLRGALVLYEKVLDEYDLFRLRAVRSTTLR